MLFIFVEVGVLDYLDAVYYFLVYVLSWRGGYIDEPVEFGVDFVVLRGFALGVPQLSIPFSVNCCYHNTKRNVTLSAVIIICRRRGIP